MHIDVARNQLRHAAETGDDAELDKVLKEIVARIDSYGVSRKDPIDSLLFFCPSAQDGWKGTKNLRNILIDQGKLDFCRSAVEMKGFPPLWGYDPGITEMAF